MDPHRIPFSGGLKGEGARRVREGESAVLVAARFPGDSMAEVEDSLSELESLAESAGLQVVGQAIQDRKGRDPRFFIGEGKAWELRVRYGRQAHLVVFDADLSGSQQGNLEESLGCRVLDRSGLILDLFAQRARTREGMAQVELAQLEYRLSRLVSASPSL
ncbi:MAG: GTPase HflX, partial [candidate division NC10 bacterium]|nr:GTPase HflX [candidate division NC10 bacterium]